ncbi:MAG: M20/M25/M40 family metallo-hydrolase [Nitrospiraceae bacterium]|nr:MAG: M20/M25/M40 family metallo-hydrolase [Nitrospiraceae bacterium]
MPHSGGNMIKADINKKRLLETFIELLSINSPSFQEKEIGSLLAKKLKERGCRVTIQKYDKSFNLIAFKKGNVSKAHPLLLSGHMDTIEPTEDIKFSIQSDSIRSTGSTVLGADDKSALAQILEALAVLQERALPHGDIEIVFTSAEEKGLHGARNLDFGKIRSRFALVLDSGGSVGKLVVAAPTQVSYEMRITGRPAHAGIEPEKGISAIRVAAEIISAVPDGRISPETTANIGMISGGTATNVVSKEVIIHGELRSHDYKVLQNTRKAIVDTAGKIAKKNKAGMHITEREEYQSFKIGENDRFLKFMDSVVQGCGIKPVHTITGGGSDANIFNNQGVKTINMSTGMQEVHSHKEYILLKDLYKGSLLVLKAITKFVEFSE